MDESLQLSIVPTHVGVNRVKSCSYAPPLHCPHARGGEPNITDRAVRFQAIVPTHVGVNRHMIDDHDWQ